MQSSLPVRAPVAWTQLGACQDEDPEIFFPIAASGPALDQISTAKAICGGCAVRLPCLHYAAATKQDGIWGGTTADERRAMREQAARRSHEPTRPPAATNVARLPSPAGVGGRSAGADAGSAAR